MTGITDTVGEIVKKQVRNNGHYMGTLCANTVENSALSLFFVNIIYKEKVYVMAGHIMFVTFALGLEKEINCWTLVMWVTWQTPPHLFLCTSSDICLLKCECVCIVMRAIDGVLWWCLLVMLVEAATG